MQTESALGKEGFCDDEFDVGISDDFELKEKIARKIAKKGDYSLILEELKKRNLLAGQAERVFSYVSDIDFLTEKDLEMLTVMELFDKITFEHCVETYRLAKEKIEKPLEDGVVLTDIMQKHGVKKEAFLRACLLHDVGKVNIPEFILNNELAENQWTEELCSIIFDENDKRLKQVILSNTNIPKSAFEGKKSFLEAFLKSRERAIDFVPVGAVLSSREREELKEKGFSENMTLKQIVCYHEVFSEQILKEYGFGIEAELAGRHHNYRQKNALKLEASISNSSVNINFNLSDIIRLVDVQQALEQKRPYKNSYPKPKVLAELIWQAEKGFTNKYITYLWVKDELTSIKEKDKTYDGYKKDMRQIEDFIKMYS